MANIRPKDLTAATSLVLTDEFLIDSLASGTRTVVPKVLGEFLTGVLNVKLYGATGDGSTDDTTAVQAAIADAAAATSTGIATVYFPPGDYKVSTTIELEKNMRLLGTGSGTDSVRGSRIICTGDNVPIVDFLGTSTGPDAYCGLEGIALQYGTNQDSSKTSAACIRLSAGSYRVRVVDVGLSGGAYGILAGGDSWNNYLEGLYIHGYSISAIDLSAGGGTTCTFVDLYIQDLTPVAADSTCSITNVSHVGAAITFTVDAVPTNVKVNTMIYVTELDAAYNGAYFVREINTLDIVVDAVSDPGAPVLTTGTLRIPAQACAGVPIKTNAGHSTWIGLQLEHVVTDENAIFQACGERCTIVDITMEACYSTNAAAAYVRSTYGPVEILGCSIYNCGIWSGSTGTLFMAAASQAQITVGTLGLRDLGHVGTTLNLAGRTNAAYPAVTFLNPVVANVTNRVNGVSTVDNDGTAVFATKAKANLAASSGVEYGLNLGVVANQSGTGGYSGLHINVTPTAEGSGQKLVGSFAYNGTTRFEVRPAGTVVNSQGAVGGCLFYDGSGSTASCYIQYGAAVDRRLVIGGNVIACYDNTLVTPHNLLVGGAAITTVGDGTAASGLRVSSAGTGMKVIKAGTAVLVGGTVTVSETLAKSTSLILLTPKVAGGTPGILSLGTVVADTSFVINSTSGTDTSTVTWVLIEPV